MEYYHNLKDQISIWIYCKMSFTLNFQHHYSSLQRHMILQKSL